VGLGQAGPSKINFFLRCYILPSSKKFVPEFNHTTTTMRARRIILELKIYISPNPKW